MTRLVRASLLLLGLGVAAALVWRVGFEAVALLVVRVGWTFAVVVAIFTIHVAVRAAALWRVMLDGVVRYQDVLRIRFAGEAVELLTLTGPFLAEPAKGWLLTRRGMTTRAAFAAVVTEYLLYTVMSSIVAIAALLLLLPRHTLPTGFQPAAIVVLTITIAFLAAFVFASVTGIGLIAPILRASRLVIGRSALLAADQFAQIEDLIIAFLHRHPFRLAEVLALEAAAHTLLVLEIWVLIARLGLSRSWIDSLIIEGGVKFVAIAFAFVPGQFGASEGVYVLLGSALGLPAAAGLSVALVRRVRGLLVAIAGLVLQLGRGPLGDPRTIVTQTK